MSNAGDFREFIHRIRSGDEAAAMELVRRYEPLIRREVRLHLEETRLARSLDSIDVSQSVLASFFVRAAAGEYELADPPQLARLLMKMARNKLASKARWQFRRKRDARRIDLDSLAMHQVADPVHSPSQVVAGQELFERFRDKLTDEERQISELRCQELSWEEVARQLGGTPDARRMQLTRAIERVVHELGLDD